MTPLIFLKLGGSLITDKDSPRTPRREVLARLAAEIAAARAARPELRLVIGHGSGSFGHVPARKHNTRQGVRTPAQWLGFAEVWQDARALNQIVVEALLDAGLPVIALPPSATLLATDGAPQLPSAQFFTRALHAGLIPLVNGDVAFDTVRGGTILSTEDAFTALAPVLRPARILLAGLEAGVWDDFPACTHLLAEITPQTLSTAASGISGSASVDVTGGMLEKVNLMLRLSAQIPGLDAFIFSGLQAGAVQSALLGDACGTRVLVPGTATLLDAQGYSPKG
ncbi:MAG: hypothetical protein JW987_14695 [Anaerolineaceae bacterium]|nr:hypothetical protein [Anaerolineaceae bacterium]